MDDKKIFNDSNFSIKDKVIAIIGSTGILGEQYVKYLSNLGAKIVIGDLDKKKCYFLSEELNQCGGDNLPLFVDNTDEKSIVSFYASILNHYNQLDVIINNAQVKPKGFYSTFENYSKKTLEQVLDGNLIGVTLSCREACKIFLEQKYGVIINISSVYGITAADQRIYNNVKNIYSNDEPFSSPVSYAISKGGIVQLTKYLSSYYREKNIRVNCLTPGGVFDEHDNDFNSKYSSKTTLGRMAKKDEYNGAIHFLCSNASSYMNGANLIIDGGWTSF